MNIHGSQYGNNSSPKMNGRNRSSSFSQIRMVVLAIIIFCAGCTPIAPITALLSVTAMEAKPTISFSPEMLDFGTLTLGHVSSAKKVTIRNDGTEPVLIDQLSVTAGFSIVASTCPLAPEAFAGQGTCTVEIAFKPSVPNSWVGELQVNYGQNGGMSMPLKGYVQGQEFLKDVVR
ncbi:choice-of-anchor D domain-containing protein [Candidatus Villigracilis saccharophilus]|uniref:choice-of-anchor D domain-containing protein n=1 Tax=Candidatus Villigracilis saccharophilus TaxID=3140684 RepID=UPI0031355564|nr:choice-of-anchor D domain-containing protein [Anaerolineales bacterium]